MKDVLGIIPARFKSSRFPGKPLVSILGKPLVIHVAEKVSTALGKENFVVATEDNRIADEVSKWGFKAVMTSDRPKTGTDRLWEVAQQIRAKIYVNIQGDEPMVRPEDIINIYETKVVFPDHIINGYTEIGGTEDSTSVNIPKVILNENEELIYMSRLPVPGIKGRSDRPQFLKQVCIYAFSYDELKAFGERGAKTYLESFEDIEILRFLEMGYKIKMVRTASSSLAVDVPDDVVAVEKAMSVR
ncbi:MAG: 3-deoxy-manno-octulosonate cytidylyltransferase [Bacteroidales bacterium]|nr:3-deoxy-manno-octulosonate cytidylyltransferase [Bacteroidales bacterium]